MRTSELQGAELDYWVARAEGIKWASIHEHPGVPDWCAARGDPKQVYAPSTTWAQGGPIIERTMHEGHKMAILFAVSEWEAGYGFYDGHVGWDSCVYATGPTGLIAAMRCYVMSKFGDTVADIPK